MKSLIAVSVFVTLAAAGAADDSPGRTVKPIKAVRRDAPYRAYWLSAPDGAPAEYK